MKMKELLGLEDRDAARNSIMKTSASSLLGMYASSSSSHEMARREGFTPGSKQPHSRVPMLNGSCSPNPETSKIFEAICMFSDQFGKLSAGLGRQVLRTMLDHGDDVIVVLHDNLRSRPATTVLL